eukprot:TRINITY_DN3223_c0_g1_i3.p1 TRINITY_DN3223_c0_g1~~TRINITY_DN3223_c0_g1_i3.p1  ORF type:complete len:241 (+),score=70.15 TRINITY_DN3223_c0_g1_i3:65-787(+)
MCIRDRYMGTQDQEEYQTRHTRIRRKYTYIMSLLVNQFRRGYFPVSNKRWSTRYPKVFLDLSVQGTRQRGRVVFELFTDKVPITAENFRRLCRGDFKTPAGKILTYKGSALNRVIPGFLAQGGEIEESIYGRYFKDENFAVSHDREGLLSMANAGKANTNSSAFFVTYAPAPWLNGKNVVFGELLHGWDILQQIEKLGSVTGAVSKQVIIENSGELNEKEGAQYDRPHVHDVLAPHQCFL